MTKVDDIVVGREDTTGATIETVYSKVDGVYAVYRTPERVVVQYADNDSLGAEQRQALASLNPVRGQINGLIDGWRSSPANEVKSIARLFDRRVADALIVALQGDQANALEILTQVKQDIIEERTSTARTQYVISATTTVAALILVLATAVLLSTFFSLSIFTDKSVYLEAAMIGAVGALFSIALMIRSRTILTDLQWRENTVDSILRIWIGAISAVVLIALFNGKLISIAIGGATTAATITTDVLIVMAFIAGFSERLVADFLSQSAISGAKANPIAGGAAPPPTVTKTISGNEMNPLGKPAPGPVASAGDTAATGRPDDHAEGCVSDLDLAASDHTDDAELPAATGGIAKPV